MTIPCVISTFPRRIDITFVGRGIKLTIWNGLQPSRPTVRSFDHNDLKDPEDVFLGDKKERRQRRGPLTRRLIVTEGIFEKDGTIVDLPELVSCVSQRQYVRFLTLWLSGIDRTATQVQVLPHFR